MLTANILLVVSCSASWCSAGTFDVEDSSVFFRSLPGQRSARLTGSGGSRPERHPSQGHSNPGIVSDTTKPITGPRGSDKAGGLRRHAGAFSDR